MTESLNFDNQLKKTLKDIAPEYNWEAGWSAEGTRWRVNVAGLKDNSPRVLVEVELRKDNPVENVAKIWRWARTEQYTEPILFLQAFSSNFVQTKPFAKPPKKIKQYNLAIFAGERMTKDKELNIDYKELRMKVNPPLSNGKRTRGGGAMLHAAQQLARDIVNLLPSRSPADSVHPHPDIVGNAN